MQNELNYKLKVTFSPNTKNGDGNFGGKLEQLTDDL